MVSYFLKMIISKIFEKKSELKSSLENSTKSSDEVNEMRAKLKEWENKCGDLETQLKNSVIFVNLND